MISCAARWVRKVCAKCDLKFAAMFKFCYSCGGPLAEAE